MDWACTESDISDLKMVSFDYIRARYEGKEFRDIGKTGKEGSIFFYKDIWNNFLEEHSKNIKEEDESEGDYPLTHSTCQTGCVVLETKERQTSKIIFFSFDFFINVIMEIEDRNPTLYVPKYVDNPPNNSFQEFQPHLLLTGL